METMADGTFCVYCKGNIEGGAVKCRACGEWLDGRWHVGGAGKICLALIAVALLVMAAMFWGWSPLMRETLADFGGRAPTFTRLVLAPWWLPTWMAVVLGTVAMSFAFVTRVRPRLTLLACALAVGVAAVVVSWWGLQLPLVNMAADVKAG
jgi:hypothetical protein